MKRPILLCALLFMALSGPAFSQAPLTITSPTTLPAPDTCTNGPNVTCAPYSFTFASSGGTSPVTWSISSSGGIPAGWALDSSTGILSGFPVVPFGFTLLAQDSGQLQPQPGQPQRQFANQFESLPSSFQLQPSITTASLPSAIQNALYSTTLAAAGGTPPFTWSAVQAQNGSVSFPAGFVPFTSIYYVTRPIANGDRLVVGTAPVSALATIQGLPLPSAPGDVFTDAPLQLAPQQSFLNVYLQTPAERQGNFSDFINLLVDPLANNAPFPGGIIPASRLPSIYAFRIGPNRTTANVLPPGLTLNPATGVLSGRPTAAGTYNIFLQATDSARNPTTLTTTVPLQLIVQPALTPTATNLPPAEVNMRNPFAYTFTASGSPPYSWNADQGILNDTWVLSNLGGNTGQSWTQLSTSGGPAPSLVAAPAVFDPATGQLLVFGGSNNNTPDLNSVWSLTTGNTPQWQLLNPTGTAPAARTGASAAYDSDNSIMMIFGGGFGSTSPCSNDTWLLNNANGVNGAPSWVQATPVSRQTPAPRIFHTAVYDHGSNEMIVFGGNNCLTQGGVFYNDVWILTNADGLAGATPVWGQLSPSGTPPPARENHTAVYDTSTNQLIIFGGNNSLAGGPPLNDVWVLSNANGTGDAASNWRQLTPTGTPPGPRAGAAAVYDPASNQMYVFGGNNGTQLLNDVWVLSNANSTGRVPPAWTQLNPPAPLPSARSTFAAAYDPNARQMFVFGGQAQAPPLPPGLRFTSNGVLTGQPTTSGTYPLRVFVSDASGQSVPISASLTISPSVGIATSSPLTGGSVQTPYSLTFAPSGGVGPSFTWSVTNGTLPVGLQLSSNVLSGTPTSIGSYSFTVQVTDTLGVTSSKQYQLSIGYPTAPPPLTLTLTMDKVEPGGQPSFQLSSGSSYPGLDIAGTLTLQFVSSVGGADEKVKFMNGTQTLCFRIPATKTNAIYLSCPLSPSPGEDMPVFQVGTTAGTIALNVTALQWESPDGRTPPQPITPFPTFPSASVAPGPPQFMTPSMGGPSITATRTTGGFVVTVSGFCTARQVTTGKFQFVGKNLGTQLLEVQVADQFNGWYQNSASNNTGTAFTYTQPFTIGGDPNSVTSVTVVLHGPNGDSQPMTATLQ